ncbi:MAG: hypothetical protein AB7E30_09275 [Lawsonibacter sp.]
MDAFASPGSFWFAYKPFIIAFAVMAVLAFGLMRLLLYTRRNAEDELTGLLHRDTGLYLERLNNNKLFRIIFRRPVLLLYKLDGYMKTGGDEEIRAIIAELDRMKLEPRDRVDYLQKRMSFFVSIGDAEEGKRSFDQLSAYLHATRADEVERYQAMLDEGREIIRVYLDKDTSYMEELLSKANDTEHPVLRGVMYFRLAKLAHFKGDARAREKYLSLATETLSNTDYEVLIKAALDEPEILEIK